MLCGGREGVSVGILKACVCGDAGVGSSVLCGASLEDSVVPGPFWGGSVFGAKLFAFKF